MLFRHTGRVQLILMRHGLAVEREEWKGDDSSRPLTSIGHDKTLLAARGMASLLSRPALIASSPKVRALQTAQLTQEAWRKKPPLETWDELAEDNFGLWLEKLRSTQLKSVLLVGHEPDLSRFTSLLLCGEADQVNFAWKKAAALALDLDLESGRATLLWMALPRVLRLLSV